MVFTKAKEPNIQCMGAEKRHNKNLTEFSRVFLFGYRIFFGQWAFKKLFLDFPHKKKKSSTTTI